MTFIIYSHTIGNMSSQPIKGSKPVKQTRFAIRPDQSVFATSSSQPIGQRPISESPRTESIIMESDPLDLLSDSEDEPMIITQQTKLSHEKNCPMNKLLIDVQKNRMHSEIKRIRFQDRLLQNHNRIKKLIGRIYMNRMELRNISEEKQNEIKARNKVASAIYEELRLIELTLKDQEELSNNYFLDQSLLIIKDV